jgi:signal transduction histidine kinase
MPPRAAHRDALTLTHRNALRLRKLVNTLLDFSRIEAGRIEAAYEPVDLAEYTTELASVFRAAVDKAGMGYRVDCERIGEPVYVDREMWEKIVLNLVSNAFKFTLDGEIHVTLRRTPTHATLEVRDTGSGIPAGELSHIFERFHRAEATQGRTHEGTGIGLALVQELVKLHGGTIEVASTVGAAAHSRSGSRSAAAICRPTG